MLNVYNTFGALDVLHKNTKKKPSKSLKKFKPLLIEKNVRIRKIAIFLTYIIISFFYKKYS